MMPLGTLGGVNSIAHGINSSGQIVGFSLGLHGRDPRDMLVAGIDPPADSDHAWVYRERTVPSLIQ
jgi:uncharacterized membrane protein